MVPLIAGVEDVVASMVTAAGFGTVLGALYVAVPPVPLVDIAPTVELPPETPLTDHVNVGLVMPDALAVNCNVPPASTVFVEDETMTAGCGGVGELGVLGVVDDELCE
jgi:hypothetical protein